MLRTIVRHARRSFCNYYAALTISAGIVGQPPMAAQGDRGSQIVRVQAGELIGGRWHPGELVAAGRGGVIVVDLADARGQKSAVLPN
ncbi:MAG TPA: hypothetical protein VFI42_00225 [Thermomicrobiaceae bacterium]|nr:hypothetical protein [Thermomicrobiaceae bacterium]HEX5328539.1 hypothetical protein [Acetobacteraceae bacterium]